jgi:hypothetical protein
MRPGNMAISIGQGERAGLQQPAAPSPPLHPLQSTAPHESSFSRAARGLAREIDVGEVQVAQASQFHSYDTGTLIALQAGIYRYTEAVDLASKIVDRATTAVHTVLTTGGH